MTTPHPPAGIASVNLTGHYVDPEGSPLQGVLTFTPPSTLTLPGATTIAALPATVKLDQNGQFSVYLIATDNPGAPTGWTYQVQETLSSANSGGSQTRTFSIFLPSSPATVDISKLAPSAPYSGQYLPVVGPAGPQGPPTTVNGHVGTSITLFYTDVGADPAGAAASAQAGAQSYTDAKISTEVSRANAAYLSATDPSVTNSRPPTGTAGGDLAGSYPSPSVAKVQGVAVTGTPAVGQVLAATSSTAATWSAPPASAPTGAAGGDLGGTYPAPTVARVQGVAVSGTPAAGQVLTATGSAAAAWSALPSASTSAPGLVQLDGTSTDIAALGVQAAGATGKSADAGHVHPMPRHDQIAAPNAPVSMANQKITNLANGSAATDAAALGQVLPLTGGTLTGPVGFSANVGFYGTSPVARSTITGAKTDTSANGALGQLLNALAALGLIVNNST